MAPHFAPGLELRVAGHIDILFSMPSPDLDYLRRVRAVKSPRELLLEPKFLVAQELFFSVVSDLSGTVDFDLADMREVHAVAALGESVRGVTVLDVGCGSLESYVLGDTFRDRYPPFFAEMMGSLGAKVTGTDIRPNISATYDHHVVDLTQKNWALSLDSSYDIVACLNLFNAPSSPFEHDKTLCDRLMDDMYSIVSSNGMLIVTLRDDLFDSSKIQDAQEQSVRQYVATKGFSLLHLDGNCAWLRIC